MVAFFLLCKSFSAFKASSEIICFVCFRILDVWEVSSPSLLSLGYKVQIGDVQGTAGKLPSSPVECSVNPSLFQFDDAYQIHIANNKVIQLRFKCAFRLPQFVDLGP